MVFSILRSAGALALLTLTTTNAFPTARQAPNYAPTLQSSTFTLVANVTSHDLSPSVNDWVVSSYHTGAGTGYAVLVAADQGGREFYVNGTAEEVRYNEASIASDGGSPPFPFGIVINEPANSVSINAGLGEKGVGLTRFPDPVPKLHGAPNGGWFACNSALPFGDAVQLFSLPLGDTAPEGCASVVLLPQCAADSGVEHPFTNIINCYEDVAGIDWTIYSA
ncbi:hypothetical protein PVAG01_10318 [Phlyctema vagabunda]|uniref:DUF7907 domain-containing protein n=1 Tax=Phlyctema vagabunda TaxID=108571 RepID=A0ABR4P5P0_9HELO